MDEASLDHGIDRLPFFFAPRAALLRALLKTGLVAGLFFSPPETFATSFGPIPVAEQALHAQYFVRARVLGSSWTRLAARVNLPYTYWKLAIKEQPLGAALGGEITVRQPGGEVGALGYHLAGTAEFGSGEDVFVPLHDTDEAPDIKEVVGLASGKYSVQRGTDGKEIVMNGLGLPVTANGGHQLSPEEFSALLHRVRRQEITEDDKNVFVTRNNTHEPAAHSEGGAQLAAREQEVRALLPVRQPSATSATAIATVVDSAVNPIQETLPPAEEPHTGSWAGSWVIAAVIVLGLFLGLAFILRR